MPKIVRLCLIYLRMRFTRYSHATNCPGEHGLQISCSERLRTGESESDKGGTNRVVRKVESMGRVQWGIVVTWAAALALTAMAWAVVIVLVGTVFSCLVEVSR